MSKPMAKQHATECARPTRRWLLRLIPLVLLVAVLAGVFALTSEAASVSFDVTSEPGEGSLGSLQLLFLFTLLALAPTLLIMVTSFTRIIIVLSLLRSAIGLQQTPPNQVLIGLALFLSLFVMQPVITEITETSLDPYLDGQIGIEEALDSAQVPLKEFMLKETRAEDLNLFLSLSQVEQPQVVEGDIEGLMSLGLEVIIPAFLTSELRLGFTTGFLLFIPFLIIDMIVASTLMSMGMVMLPPSIISLPFKLMLFVVVNGWTLVIETLISGFV